VGAETADMAGYDLVVGGWWLVVVVQACHLFILTLHLMGSGVGCSESAEYATPFPPILPVGRYLEGMYVRTTPDFVLGEG